MCRAAVERVNPRQSLQHKQVQSILYYTIEYNNFYITLQSCYTLTIVATVCIISAGSTAVLVNFRATAQSSSSISVQWDRLTPCRDVNGLIVEFRVQYRALPSGPVQTLPHAVQSDMWIIPVEVSLTGLIPFTNYSIQAAPVNELGHVGLYSDTVITQTEEDSETIALYIVYHIKLYNNFLSPSSSWSCGHYIIISLILQDKYHLGPT